MRFFGDGAGIRNAEVGVRAAEPIWGVPSEPSLRAVPRIVAMHHVALSVADIDRSAAWYERLLGVERVMTDDSPQRRMIVYRFPGVRLTFGLVQHGEARSSSFDPAVVGLDTAAFSVGTRADLDAWVEHFEHNGVIHTGMKDTPLAGS